jgi:phosphate transport system permease protein
MDAQGAGDEPKGPDAQLMAGAGPAADDTPSTSARDAPPHAPAANAASAAANGANAAGNAATNAPGNATSDPPGARGYPFALQAAPAAKRADRLARVGFMAAALSVFLVLGFIIWVLAQNSALFFSQHSAIDFFFGTKWHQAGTLERLSGGSSTYSVLPLLAGTLLVTVGAAIIGLPLGLATAIYLAEYASPRIRGLVKPTLEILAGIPSIVFGFFALEVISPIVQRATEPGTVLHAVFGQQAIAFNALSAIIVVGIMVLPIVASLSEDALHAVPGHLREASVGLGATQWETTRKVVVPAALSGITASFVLGIARAIGETMAVALAAGNTPNLTFNPVETIQTMTAFMVQRQEGDLPQHGPDYNVLFAVGAALFAMTMALNIVARRFVRRYRQVEA